MNGESFYDSFHDWQPPSPRSTPQSAKYSFYPFQSPVVSGTSPILNSHHHGWMTSQPPTNLPIGQNQAHTGYNSTSRPSNTGPPKRQRPQSAAYSPPLSSGQQPQMAQPSSSEFSQGEFPSGSFVERFDSTTLDDPFTAQPGMSAATPAQQMHTPPPTRDDSTRRKPHQPRLAEFQTPSTIASRRMSAPSDAWQPHVSDAAPFPDPSPFTFTPLQFSPPPSHFGFTPSGPMTAPVYPQSTLFWDPNSNQTLNQMSFSTIAEEPFGMHPNSNTPSFAFETPLPTTHRFTASDSFRAPNQTTSSAPRPQSARPADLKHSGSLSRSSMASATSSVDPTVLWNTQTTDTTSFSRPDPVQHPGNAEARQPYQHQAETLRREKEERSRRAQKSGSGQNASEVAPNSAERSLRRSLTDSRARRSGQQSHMSNQASFVDVVDPTYNTSNAFIPREASPLKRHKAGTQHDQLTPTKSRSRRSIVLTVDEQGNARTEVKAVAEPAVSSSLYRVARSMDGDSDSSDLPETVARNPNLPAGLGTSPPSSDAQEALREVVRNRKMQRPDFNRGAIQQDSGGFSGHLPYSSLPSSASKSNPNSSSSYSNNSPTTITDPEFHTPTRDRNAESSGSTRCICNGRVPEDRANLMIECESCKNWLHVACLGISPEQIPPVFICLFCSSTPAARRIRPYQGQGTAY